MIVLLTALALARVVQKPRLLLRGFMIVSQGLMALFALLGLIGRLRFPGLTSTTHLAHLAFIILAAWSLMVLSHQARVLKGLLVGWLVAGGLSLLVGLAESLTGAHLPGNAPANYYRTRLPSWNQSSAFFDNPNLFAYQLVVVGQVLVIIFFTVRGWRRWLVAAGAVLVAQQLLATDGRIAMAVLAASLALFALRTRPGRLLVPLGAVGVVIGYAAGWGLPHQLVDPFILQFQGTWGGRSAWVRVGMLRAAWHMAQSSGWWGVGPGGFDARVVLPSNPYRVRGFTNPHFGMAEVLAEYGLVGLVALLLALVGGAVFCLRRALGFARAGWPQWGRVRTLAVMTAVMLSCVPMLTLAHSTWLRQPLTAVHLGTLAALVAVVGWQNVHDPDTHTGG